jgi:membrane protease YdiL (CAAX protease family)
LRLLPENSNPSPLVQPFPPPPPGPVAPIWHTIILIAGIVLISLAGAEQFSGNHPAVDRMHTYGVTAATELFMLAWIYFGLRLRKVPFRTLLGSVPGNFRSFALDVGLAIVFWISSLFTLATIGIVWTIIEAAIQHRALFVPGKPLTPDASQQETLHTLLQLAPAGAREVAAWICLCIVAGIAEEVVFRGYLYRQFTARARGSMVVGIIVSSLFFGAAHGYQGARNMVLLTIFGALFCLLALFRRSLRPGIIAHAWQDLFAGLMLAFLRSHHVL